MCEEMKTVYIKYIYRSLPTLSKQCKSVTHVFQLFFFGSGGSSSKWYPVASLGSPPKRLGEGQISEPRMQSHLLQVESLGLSNFHAGGLHRWLSTRELLKMLNSEICCHSRLRRDVITEPVLWPKVSSDIRIYRVVLSTGLKF